MDPRSYDQAIEKVGGAFKLSVLLQRRIRELVRGARPLVKLDTGVQMNPIEIALKEILEDKICFAFDGEIPRFGLPDIPEKPPKEAKPAKEVQKKKVTKAKKKK
jgi:DNA-directed RNA polymerase subunit omega